ncbi:MAG: hypothetical protein V4564_06705 [Pseudomonadota bacterium]|uniref:hypothetical protein n=1 Tax=Sphingomonas sp. ERG5 TaxID=1381597 RepID=UPI00054B4B55|nr:hypothetical protein [Sphingomonas sp. ERG5]
MSVLRHFNMFRAVNDLRDFLRQRRPHELGFLLLSVALFGVILVGFTIDSHEERVYRPNIIYVQQWPASRTDAEIRAQQKIDAPIEAKRKADEEAQRKKTQEDFKRLDRKLEKLGI